MIFIYPGTIEFQNIWDKLTVRERNKRKMFLPL